MKTTYPFIFVLLTLLIACGEQKKSDTQTQKNNKEKVYIPDFNHDSAYLYVKQQVDFGPRIPNSKEHKLCFQFLFEKINSFADTTIVQPFSTRAFDGTILQCKNIIGSFNLEAKSRVLLCAHWDSRPFADYDPDPDNYHTPIDGANDGASGVGVLLEVARQLNIKKPNIGIDIIFFDAEDYGPPPDKRKNDNINYWALGSQYWAGNPHDPSYDAKYGILLDMVGAENATFFMEGFSLYFAHDILRKVWKTGHKLGYQDYFIFKEGGFIDDDHKPINEIINIPTIDIIHIDTTSEGSFFEHWHTISDNMSVIDKETLKVVGKTVLKVIYEEK